MLQLVHIFSIFGNDEKMLWNTYLVVKVEPGFHTKMLFFFSFVLSLLLRSPFNFYWDAYQRRKNIYRFYLNKILYNLRSTRPEKGDVKPWPNGQLASRRKSTQILFDLRSTCVSLGHPALASTCDDLRWFWSSSNSYASRRKFSPFGHPTQVVDTSWSQVICICVKFTTCVNLRADLRIRLITHRKSVPSSGQFCKLASTSICSGRNMTVLKDFWRNFVAARCQDLQHYYFDLSGVAPCLLCEKNVFQNRLV